MESNLPSEAEQFCQHCGKAISRSGDDWTAADGTACGGQVTYDGNGDPVIGHHMPRN